MPCDHCLQRRHGAGRSNLRQNHFRTGVPLRADIRSRETPAPHGVQSFL
jgi:hypothetical protein